MRNRSSFFSRAIIRQLALEHTGVSFTLSAISCSRVSNPGLVSAVWNVPKVGMVYDCYTIFRL